MVAIGAFVAVFVQHDMAFQDDLRLGRHLQRHGLAVDQLNLLAAQQAGELIFRQRVRDRCDRRQDGPRIRADDGGGGQGFRPFLLPAGVVLCPAAMFQPAHQGRVAAGHLHAVDAQIERVGLVASGIGPLCHHQRPGDQRCGLARPASLNRQARQIDIVTLQNDLVDRGAGHRLRFHRQNLFDQRQQTDRVFQAARRFRLAQEGQGLADRPQFLRRPIHAQRDPFHGSEQIDQHRHLRRFSAGHGRVLKQYGRPAILQQPGLDLGHLQLGRYRRRHPVQQAASFQHVNEVAEGGIGHKNVPFAIV